MQVSSLTGRYCAALGTNERYLAARCLRWAHLPRDRFAPSMEIDHRQHRKRPIGVLHQTPIAHLGEAPMALERQKRMFDLGAHRRLASVGLFVRLAQGSVPVGALVGKVLRVGRHLSEPFALVLAPVGAVAVKTGFVAGEQIGQLAAVVHIRRGHAGAVDYAAATVCPDVHLHPKVPFVAFLSLMHLRVAGLVLVLCGRRRCNQGGVNDRATRQLHAISHQQLANPGKHGCPDLMALQQVTELQQGGGIGHSFSPKIYAAELTKCRNVVQRILTRLVSKVEPVGKNMRSIRSKPTGGRPLPRLG